MNTEAAPVPAAPALVARAGTLDTILTLARRELWEHRSLWIAPLVVQGLLLLGMFVGHTSFDEGDGPHTLTAQQRVALFTIVQWALAQPLFIVTAICVGFYLLDCLYAERKDRSILFWKSLPVSDGLTVASKFLVAAVVVPLGALVLALVSDLVYTAILFCVLYFGVRISTRVQLALVLVSATVVTIFPGGMPSLWADPSMIRLFAWCGINQSTSLAV